MTKVAIIGCGKVGSTIAYALATKYICQEIVLIDINYERAKGEALDISHALDNNEVNVYAGNYSDLIRCNIIIISGGEGRKPGQDRFDLLTNNALTATSIAESIRQNYDNSVIIVLSNPVDIITYIIAENLKLPKGKVIGTGTLLDTNRFKYELSKYFNVDNRNITGFVLGGHGEHNVPIFSMTRINGISIDEYANLTGKSTFEKDMQTITSRIINAGTNIVAAKGATFYGISGAIQQLVKGILTDSNIILPTTSLLNGEYNLYGSATSLLSVIGKHGAKCYLTPQLNTTELEKILHAASHVKTLLDLL